VAVLAREDRRHHGRVLHVTDEPVGTMTLATGPLGPKGPTCPRWEAP